MSRAWARSGAAKLLVCDPGALQKRSSVCTLQRHRATTGLVRQDRPPSPLSRRRPPSKQRDPHDRDVAIDEPSRVARLPRAQNQPRQDPQRSHALAETPHLTPPLPQTERSLDTIEASEPSRSTHRPTAVSGRPTSADLATRLKNPQSHRPSHASAGCRVVSRSPRRARLRWPSGWLTRLRRSFG